MARGLVNPPSRYGTTPEEREEALARSEDELMLEPCVQFIDIDADEFVRI